MRVKRVSGFAALIALLLLIAAWSLPLAQDEEPEFPHRDFDGDCTLCHGDEGWKPTVIDPEFRGKIYPFPLRQAHDLQDCRACQSKTLDITKAGPSSVSCHLDPHRDEFEG